MPATSVSNGAADLDLLHWSHWWFLEGARYMDIRVHAQWPMIPDGRTALLDAPHAPSRQVVREVAIPQLLSIAKAERADDVLASALIALGRLVEPGDTELGSVRTALTSHLAHPNGKVRESAILSLGLIGEPRCTAVLIELIEGGDAATRRLRTASISARTRAFAAHALGLSALRTSDVVERQRIALALVSALEEGESGREDVAVAAISSLGLIDVGERMSVPAAELRTSEHVEAVLSNGQLATYIEGWLAPVAARGLRKSVNVRAHACVAYARQGERLGSRRRTRGIETLLAIGSDRSTHAHVRASVVIALGEIAHAGLAEADREARRHLLKVIRHGQPLERRFALIAAAQSCTKPGAGETPMEGWSEVETVLLGQLAKARSSDMAWAAIALGIVEDAAHRAGIDTGNRVGAALQNAGVRRRSDDDSAAIGIGLALAGRNTESAARFGKSLMKEMAQTTTPQMRGHMSVALGLLDHDEASKVLYGELEESSNQAVRFWSAAVGLAMMGETVDGSLVDGLRATKSSTERLSISSALGQTGTAKAVQPLLGLIDNELLPSAVRASAIDSLGAICDSERLPWRDPIAHALPYFASTPVLNSGGGLGVLERPW